MELLPGELIGQFRIVSEIGRGGMGVVYLGRDTQLDRAVAIKSLPAELARDPQRFDLFRREARLLASVNHPAIAIVHGLEKCDGDHYLILEHIEGKSLRERMGSGALEWESAVRIVVQMTEALRAAHEKGIVHRDVKPENVMITADNRVKLLDFGLAKRVIAESSESETEEFVTEFASIRGTIPYMSPEQIEARPLDHRSDLFSVGVVLYELVAGRRPFSGPSNAALMSSILRDSPAALDSGAPGQLEAIIARCLAKSPDDRYAQAELLARDLAALIERGRIPEALCDDQSFVGRKQESAHLFSALERAKSGHGGLVLLSGEPGVGRTRLAKELLAAARAAGMRTLVGRAYESGSIPFISVTEVLEELVERASPTDLDGMLDGCAAEVCKLVPEIRGRAALETDPDGLPPEIQQRRMYRGLWTCLARASRQRPMVMLLDDVQWADDSTLGFLEFVASRVAELPFLVIATYREGHADESGPFADTLSTLLRQRLAETVRVRPFDSPDVADLLRALGGSDPPPDLVCSIHAATEGNAFFIEEMFRHFADEGQLFEEDGRWRGSIGLEQFEVPQGVRVVISKRLRRLTDAGQQALTVAAVCGLRFDARLVEAIVSNDVDAIESIEEAASAGIVRPEDSARGSLFEFVHVLVKQTVLAGLSPLRIQRIHRSAADALEGGACGDPARFAAELADHLVNAGVSVEPDRTAKWLLLAGESALQSLAVGEAAGLLSKGLELVGDRMSSLRCRLLYRRGAAMLSTGDREGFTTDLKDAFEGLLSLGLSDDAASAVSDLSYTMVWSAEPGEAEDLITRALEVVDERQSAARCRLLSARGIALGMAARPGEAERATLEAVRIARQSGEPALLAQVLKNHGVERFWRLDGVTMGGVAKEAAAVFREARQEWSLGHCLWMQQVGLVWQGRYAQAASLNTEIQEVATRNEDLGTLALSAIMNSLIDLAGGDLTSAMRSMRRSVELFEEGGFPWGYISEGHYSVIAMLAGQDQLAREAFERAGENALVGVSWSGADSCYLLSGKAALGDADARSVYARLEPSIPTAGGAKTAGSIMLLLGAIEALAEMGQTDRAGRLYPAIKGIVDAGKCVQSFTYGLTERFAGMAAAAAGRHSASERHFVRAIDLADELPHRVDQVRCRYWYGRSLLNTGESSDRDEALSQLRDARTLCRARSMPGLLARIERALAEAA